MLIFNNNSWHYKLILYTFGPNFFLDTSEIDWQKLEAMKGEDVRALAWQELPRKSKAKTVNLCPYLRALVGSVITLPFVWLLRKIPRKPRKPRTHIEVMKSMERRSLILRLGLAALNIGLGAWRILDGEWAMAAFNIGVGLFIIFIKKFGGVMLFISAHWPKRKRKVKKAKAPKNPSLLKAKLEAEHEKICPPIFFIDAKREEDLK